MTNLEAEKVPLFFGLVFRFGDLTTKCRLAHTELARVQGERLHFVNNFRFASASFCSHSPRILAQVSSP